MLEILKAEVSAEPRQVETKRETRGRGGLKFIMHSACARLRDVWRWSRERERERRWRRERRLSMDFMKDAASAQGCKVGGCAQ